jgi:hypothetical protein
MAHHHEQNGRIYVDTAFLNGTNRIPGVTLKHMGFGEFYAETPKGRVDFDRMRGKDFPGQSGRSHEFRGKGADWLLDQMERAGITVRVASKDTDMNADRSALIRLAALLPKGSPERRAILAGCEKLPEGPMRDNCEKSKKDGVKPGKGKAKSKGKKDDGKMPAELLEKFKAKKKAKRKAPPKEHQFTSEDNPNPKGDGETNEPKPFKGKKAALVRLAAALPKGSDERKTLLAMVKSAGRTTTEKVGDAVIYKTENVHYDDASETVESSWRFWVVDSEGRNHDADSISEARSLARRLSKKAAAPIGSGENGYVAMYKNKRVEVMADTQYEAQQLAAKHFRARKPYEVSVMLAEKGGKQVTHMPLFASKKTASRPLHVIAREIAADWGPKVHYAAKPYLRAMMSLDSINDSYGYDDADMIVRYFLTNARSWRGPVAKQIKAELKRML